MVAQVAVVPHRVGPMWVGRRREKGPGVKARLRRLRGSEFGPARVDATNQ